MLHQHFDIVTKLLLHRGKSQPGPGPPCVGLDNRKVSGGGGDLLSLTCPSLDQLQDLPELPSSLEEGKSLGFEAMSQAELEYNKQLVEDLALLV